jgi:hypothetical protein
MDLLLGGLAFAAIIFGQFSAVVAVQGESKSHQPEAFDTYRTRLIWDSGN